MTRVLLFGANGQLGHDIAAAAADPARGVTVVPFGRDRLDLDDLSAIGPALDAEDFDVAVYCSSIHKTDAVEDDATPAFRVNAHAAEKVAAHCAERGRKCVYYSTDYVFSGADGSTPYREEDAPGPVNVYGASKAMGERLVLRHPGVTVLRVASLFGVAGASGKGGNFVETMIRVGREKGELKVVADQVMSPTATADIADMTLRLLAADAPAGVYHAVNSGQASWYEFASEIIARAGVDATVSPTSSAEYKTRAMRPAHSVLDNSKISEVLGAPPHWTDALDRYLAARTGE